MWKWAAEDVGRGSGGCRLRFRGWKGAGRRVAVAWHGAVWVNWWHTSPTVPLTRPVPPVRPKAARHAVPSAHLREAMQALQ